MDWELIRQRKRTQINNDNIRENSNRVDHDYIIRDKFMLINNSSYEYETPYKGTFVIMQCLNNGTVKLQCGATKIRYSIHCINPYTYDTNIEDINFENIYMTIVNI